MLADHLLFDIVWKNDLWPSFPADTRAIVIADCYKAGGAFTEIDALKLSLGRVKDFIMHFAEMFAFVHAGAPDGDALF